MKYGALAPNTVPNSQNLITVPNPLAPNTVPNYFFNLFPLDLAPDLETSFKGPSVVRGLGTREREEENRTTSDCVFRFGRCQSPN